MKIATWNINGIRARRDALLAWINEKQPDILVLEELKAQEENMTKASLVHYKNELLEAGDSS